MAETLPFVMFAVLGLCLLLGFPVAFTISGIAMVFGFATFGGDLFNLLPLRIWGVMSNYTLVAVPLFVFMGVMLDRSGLAQKLLDTMGLLFGPLRGGLAMSVVLVGALLAACTGIVGATITTMGIMALPTMLRRNYSGTISSGTICASGTLGQIMPPSIVLVLVGDILGIPIGELFLGAVLPALVLVILYVAYIVSGALLTPERMPALPASERQAVPGPELLLRVCKAVLPSILLIVAVLGSIMGGVATPTEAAALGAAGSIVLALANGQLRWRMLYEVGARTMVVTTMVFMILIGAKAFGLAFQGMDGDDLVVDSIANLEMSRWQIFAAIMIVIFLLGFILDFIEIAFIVLPVIAPLILHLGMDPVWFGVVLGINLQTSFLTPPFGFALFYLRGVAPAQVSTGMIYRGVLPFVVLQVIALGLVIAFPGLALWLPEAVFG